MRLPPEPVVLAASRWLELLPVSGGVPRAQALLAVHPDYSDLTPTQYATALGWLRDLGLLEEVTSSVPPATRIMTGIVERTPPPWVRDADLLVQSPEELPSDIVATGQVLGLTPEAVHAHVVNSWSKVDTAARERVGTAGEAALVALLQTIPGGAVEHVAAWSDGFGYDIAFTLGRVTTHLEVKSTTRTGRFTAYLSRHEYDVMLRDPDWVLVTVRMTAEFDLAEVGSVSSEWVAANVPRDDGAFGTWASVKLNIPAEVISGGIPHLGEGHLVALPGGKDGA